MIGLGTIGKPKRQFSNSGLAGVCYVKLEKIANDRNTINRNIEKQRAKDHPRSFDAPPQQHVCSRLARPTGECMLARERTRPHGERALAYG